MCGRWSAVRWLVRLIFAHNFGSGPKILDSDWALFFTGVVNGVRSQEGRRLLSEAITGRNLLSSYPRKTSLLQGDRFEENLIYSKEDSKACFGAINPFHLFINNNLEEVFSDSVTQKGHHRLINS